MTEHWQHERVLTFLEGDREILEFAAQHPEWCAPSAEGFSPEDVETLRVLRVLVRELEVNWEGAEVAMQLRAELLLAQRQVRALLQMLEERR